MKLNFNHPCKFIVWFIRNCQNTDISQTKGYGGPQWYNFTDKIDKTFFSGSTSSPYGPGMPSQGNFYLNNASGGDELFKSSDFDSTRVRGDLSASDPCCDLSGAPETPCDLSNKNPSPIYCVDNGFNPVQCAKLQLNGHDRFSQRYGDYFNYVQPYQHFSCTPSTGINVYSFALKPEEHQPSGTCNFSRIDNASLHIKLTESACECPSDGSSVVNTISVFAVNYNVLRIMSGMGGLAYSN